MVLPTFFHFPNPPPFPDEENRLSLSSQLSTSNTLKSSSSVNRTLFRVVVLATTPGMSIGMGVESPLEVVVVLVVVGVGVGGVTSLVLLDDDDSASSSRGVSTSERVVSMGFCFLSAERREWIEKGGDDDEEARDEGEEDRLLDAEADGGGRRLVGPVHDIIVSEKRDCCTFGVGAGAGVSCDDEDGGEGIDWEEGKKRG